MRIYCLVAILLAMTSTAIPEESTSPLHLIPWPASVKASPNSAPMVIQTSFAVGLKDSADPRLRRTAEIFLNDLRRAQACLASPGEVRAAQAQLATAEAQVKLLESAGR